MLNRSWRIREIGRLLRTPILGFVLLSGCVRRQEVDDSIFFSVEPVAIVLLALAALSVAASGWFLRKAQKWLGIGLVVIGGVVLCTTVPGFAVSGTLVTSDRFEWRQGVHVVKATFDELAEIVHSTDPVPVARSRPVVHRFVFRYKNELGPVSVQADSLRDAVFIEALPEIFRRARTKGVEITEVP